ncbi:MAG: TRAP transporter large permease subunit, partial [Pseudomonadota bacterium]
LYGLLTDTSVPELYLAGFLPGFLLAALFMATVVVLCVLRPGWGGERVQVSWAERLAALPALLPPIGIFLVVVGSIYAGLATPTEAAALGVVAALILAAFNRTLSIDMLRQAIEGTIRTTSMIMLIILAAVFLNFVLSVIGLTQALADFVTGLGISPMQTMLVIVLVLLIVGCFMETLSMLLTTAPLIAPIVIALGFDPVWFGILLMVLLETALITPPIGINLYVVQGVRERGEIVDVMIGAAPFVVTMVGMIGLLLAFPQIALWLPEQFY